jgi:hypothetical protein
MKFKFLLLSMLGAAAVISCNNESIIDGDKPGGGPVEGVPVYASFDFKLSSNPVTYAGNEADVVSTTEEGTVTNASMYVYKFDGASLTPEFAVFVGSISANNRVTMKATSGRKKIFLACNAFRTTAGSPTYLVSGAGTLLNYSTAWGTSYGDLNDTLYTASATDFSFTPSTGGMATKADGLIKALAKGGISGPASPAGSFYPGADYMLMTNWDGPADVSTSGSFSSTCDFTLNADVDSASSRGGTLSALPDSNRYEINVQRAFAKVTLTIASALNSGNVTSGSGFGSDFTTSGYKGAAGEDQEGEFHPWGSGSTDAIWSLGNIPKATLPFQQYVGGSVRDMYYQLNNDSVTSGFTNWTNHYDNSRVFPTGMPSYPWEAGLTVTLVRTAMTTTDNNAKLGDYAYTPESARQHPVLQSQHPYVIIGGRYYPKKVLIGVTRSANTGNPPTVSYADNYNWAVTTNDTLYYIASEKVFIAGQNILQRYYAWVKGLQPDADATNPVFNAATNGAINAARDAGDLLAYFEAQCWYRVSVLDPDASTVDQTIVRRNHMYEVNITAIKGPGIGDPNKIITDKPILALETYVTATIKVLPWHKVKQEVEVDQN